MVAGQLVHWRSAKGPQGNEGSGWVPAGQEVKQASNRIETAKRTLAESLKVSADSVDSSEKSSKDVETCKRLHEAETDYEKLTKQVEDLQSQNPDVKSETSNHPPSTVSKTCVASGGRFMVSFG